jgi:Fe-S-cluster containining protein
MNTDEANQLCLKCGLCCNGVIFAHGQLLPADDAVRLQVLGLRLKENSKLEIRNPKFRQPCAAFDGCRCKIYFERPQYCRQFDCLLLKSVKEGRTKTTEAVHTIKKARRSADKIKKLLRQLGDIDEQVALSLRFRRTQKRMEAGKLSSENATVFGDLTLAMHSLNMLLAEKFYPGD